MGVVGLALNDAIPKMVNTYGAIQGLQERAKAMRMKEELHPLEMEQQQNQNKNLQTQNALGEVTLQQKKNELMKQEQLNKMMNTPQNVNDMFRVKDFQDAGAGDAMNGFIGDLRDFGALEPILDSNGQVIGERVTPYKSQLYMEQNKGKFLGRINESILRMNDTESNLKQQLTSGAIKEKDAPQVQQQLKKIQQMKAFWQTQADALEAELKITEKQTEQKYPITLESGQTVMATAKEAIDAEKKKQDQRDTKVVVDKSSPTGYSYQDLISGKLYPNAPAPKEGTTVNVSNKLETEEAKAIGKARGEIYKNISEANANALTSNATLDEMEQYLEKVETGKLTPLATDIAQWGQSLGIKIDPKWNSAQALDAVSKKFALTFRNPAGGSGMPGNFSDQDRKYLEQIAPSLGKSAEANKMIIDAMRKINQRKLETQQLADEFYEKNGTLKGFTKYMQDYAKAHPLFPKSNQTSSGNRFTVKETK